MCRAADHTIHSAHRHFGWDNSIEPVQVIAPGETVEISCIDAGDGQLTSESTAADIPTMDPGRVNPVTGPIFVDGAAPGDALRITIDRFAPSGFGWTANIPGFGLLADQFPDPALHIWSYDRETLSPAAYSPVGRVPLRPFAGTIGCALAEPGRHSVIPPRRVGGNMDIRDLSAGTVLYLPVEVEGALLSVGDTHAAQGDGEVCGTAIESPMDVALTVELEKRADIAMPRFTTAGPVTRHLDAEGYEVTTGVGADVMEAARIAVGEMIELLAARTGMSPVEAYMLCSVCGDLRISEIVDMPNVVVAFYFPRVVLS
ncbi:acetamidase/formamidase family protein [Amorphus sp. 3PC139-8]|uniref:acetamidase/formamidase family protein n=1 Tax=Amorphus sp. 3PC139-8 TaxID=2735676 RepID=UPI00345DCC0E